MSAVVHLPEKLAASFSPNGRDEARADGTIHQLVKRQAELAPGFLAVSDGDWQLSYRDLDRLSDDLAVRILQISARHEARIAVLLPASAELLIAELAILKAGRAFLPIDPDYPVERIIHLVEDSSSSLVLTLYEHREKLSFSALPTILLDDLRERPETRATEIPAMPSDPQRLAYVIYTSGSTGLPKGVMVEHASVCNLIAHFQESLQLSPQDRASFASSSSFDASIIETWPYLASGASVHIVPRGLKTDLHGLFAWLQTHRITVAFIPTVLTDLALKEGFPEMPDLRVMLTGGDKLQTFPSGHLHFRLLNAYGPTECTVISSWSELEPDPLRRRAPSIGRSISNVEVLILDEALQPTPVGVCGEIYIAGAGVARGYLNRSELTALKFLRDPSGRGRMYRTGDLACWRGDQEIAFLGRNDRQVQLGGIRIEPGEIEFVLQSEIGVADAMVIAEQRAPYPARLAAYVASDEPEAELIRRLKKRVAETLPAHMHPVSYVVLKSLPLTAHGKVDITQLPRPGGADASVPGVSPGHAPDLRSTVTAIWKRVLDVPQADDTDNFFSSGGDSILVLILLAEVEKECGMRIPLGTFLQSPTIGHMIALLKSENASTLPTCVVNLNDVTGPQPFFCVAGAGGGVHWFHPLVKAAHLDRPFYGLESQSIGFATQPEHRVQALAAEFLKAIRQIQPKGPYLLGGYSFGGLVALEIAKSLAGDGEEIQRLVLIDTYARMPRPKRIHRILFVLRTLLRASQPERVAFVREKLNWLKYLVRRRASGASDESTSQKSLDIADALRYMQSDLNECLLPLELLVARDGSRVAGVEASRGWRQVAKAGLRILEIPGTHYTILSQPHVNRMGQHLKEMFTR